MSLYWSIVNNRWEADGANSTPGVATFVIWVNSANSSPNPPDLTLGTWTDISGFCGSLTQMDGSGTQSTLLSCNAGSTAPTLSTTTASNTCPATTVDLDALHTGTIPASTSLVWSTDNDASDGLTTTETSPTSNAGTYYAYYFDSANTCYSPASAGCYGNY